MPTDKQKRNLGEVSGGEQSVKGQYANYFKVGYNAFEFVIDFGQSYTGNDQAELYTRMILPPVFAKSLFETLKSSIEIYEAKYGDINQIKNSKGVQKK